MDTASRKTTAPKLGTVVSIRSTNHEAGQRHDEVLFDPVLTMAEVGERLGVSRATIYNLVIDPAFVTFRIGRQRRMRESALRAWIEMQELAGE